MCCAVTGRVVTAETKMETYINGKTEEWMYLRTWDSNKPKRRIYVKLEIILQEVEKLLSTLHLEPELHSEVTRLKKCI